MKKILLLLTFSWMVGILPAHAFDLFDQSGLGPFQPYPYPSELTTGIDNLPQGYNTIVLGNETFYYSEGKFYQKIIRDDKYAIVPPPIGAEVVDLPVGSQYMLINGNAYYVFNGVYYKRVLDGYRVIFPPSGV